MSEDRFKALVAEAVDAHFDLRQTINNVNRLAKSIERITEKHEDFLHRLGVFEGQLKALPDAHLATIRADVLTTVKHEQATLAKRVDEMEKRQLPDAPRIS